MTCTMLILPAGCKGAASVIRPASLARSAARDAYLKLKLQLPNP